jgi:hypothetical protein
VLDDLSAGEIIEAAGNATLMVRTESNGTENPPERRRDETEIPHRLQEEYLNDFPRGEKATLCC